VILEKDHPMKSTILNLNGGLGNQLFGLSFALSIQKNFNTSVKLDCSNLAQRGYQLSDLKILPGIHSLENPFTSKSKNQYRVERLFHLVDPNIYVEKSFSYDPKIYTRRLRKRYIGYFQSWKYVEKVSLELNEIFRHAEDNNSRRLAQFDFYGKKFVTVHVRRGDYVSLENYHGLVSEDYYMEALESLLSRVGNIPICVFSDDIHAARKIIPKADFYVGTNQELSPLQNLLLMSGCSYLIGANSSYSWWAGYIAKQVNNCEPIFPKPWFVNSKVNTTDLLYPDWKSIEKK
jgi:hypothetical protein